MSNPALLWLPLRSGLDGRDRNGVVTATASGPVRFTANGYYAEEGTTNLCPNPVIDSGTAACYFSGGDAVMDRVTDRPDLYPTALRLIKGSVASDVQQNAVVTPSTTAPRTFVGSFEAVGSSEARIYLSAHGGSGGAVYQTQTPIQLTDTPTRFVTAPFSVPGDLNAVVLHLMLPTGVAFGTQARISKWQIEEKAYATSFAHGSMGTGYSWAGPAHNSASTRQRSQLLLASAGRLPQGAAPFTYAMRVTPVASYPDGVDTAAFWGNNSWNWPSGPSILLQGTNDRLVVAPRGNGGWGVAITSPYAIGSTYTAIMDWNGTTFRGFLGSTLIGSTTPTPESQYPNTGANVLMAIGDRLGGVVVRDFMSFDRLLTDAERATLAATPEWSFGVLADGGIQRMSGDVPVFLSYPGAGLSSRFVEVGGSIR